MNVEANYLLPKKRSPDSESPCIMTAILLLSECNTATRYWISMRVRTFIAIRIHAMDETTSTYVCNPSLYPPL